MNTLTRVVASWLRWRESRRDQAARPGWDGQFADWVQRAESSALDRAEAEIVQLRRKVTDLQRLARSVEALHALQIDARNELLGAIWLYINWHYVTRQLTTEQKNLWADAVDTTGDPDDHGPKAERWWT